MVVNVKPEDLTEAIRGSLESYSEAVTEKVNEELEKVAEDTADTLKKGGYKRLGRESQEKRDKRDHGGRVFRPQ